MCAFFIEGENEYSYYLKGINPEPWAIGNISVGRGKNGYYPRVAQNGKLAGFQAEVKEALADAPKPPADILNSQTKLSVTFLFKRKLTEDVLPSGRKRRAKAADATNLQKGLEDALQGVLFSNDSNNVFVRSAILEQSFTVDEPEIIIIIGRAQDEWGQMLSLWHSAIDRGWTPDVHSYNSNARIDNAW